MQQDATSEFIFGLLSKKKNVLLQQQQ